MALHPDEFQAAERPSRSVVKLAALCLGLSLVVELVTAALSEGFHHFDEHFQILEFASYKLGHTPVSDLRWEFRERMRPWLQPALLHLIASAWKAVGVASPFHWILSARILSALLGWLSTASLVLSCLWWFRPGRIQRWAIIATCFTWYLPYTHARFSSEGWSTSLFYMGFALLVRHARLRLASRPHAPPASAGEMLSAGLLFGFAFDCRYQVGIMVLSSILWCVVVGRFRAKALLLLSGGLLVAIGVGALCDRWGYGSWTLTPWNFLRVNLIEGRLKHFGSEPWWFYLPEVLVHGGPPLSILLIAGTVLAWVMKPRFSLTWATLPFVAVHALLVHKELRFLFPAAPAAPILSLAAAEVLGKAGFLAWDRWPALARKALVGLLLFVNSGLLALRSLTPARTEIGFYRVLYSKDGPLALYAKDRHPYQTVGLATHYYRPDGLTIHQVSSYEDILDAVRRSDRPIWVFRAGLELPQEASSLEPYCRLECSTIPAWLLRPPYSHFWKRGQLLEWSLFRCGRQ